MPQSIMHLPLYGRQAAVAKLMHGCRRAGAVKPAWVLIEGPAGIGKTSLVKFVRATLQLAPTQYGFGKFEQFHRQTPYGALIAALRKLLQAVMLLPEPERQAWQEALRGGADIGLAPLADVLPELVLLLGALPPPAALPPKEAQDRQEAAFTRLMACFARADHPLMLFLDDLQWADVATLRLLRKLGADVQLAHLILLGTFRDNEVTALHPLTPLLDGLERQSPPPTRIRLAPLSRADIGEWLADAYGLAPEDAAAPAAWLRQQSEGNPLFVGQLLGSLCKRGVLRRPVAAGAPWHWDAALLSEAQLSGDIVNFMEARLHELPAEQQGLLSCAACLGTEFGIADLVRILQLPDDQVQALLARTQEGQLTEHVRDGNWRFAHDRIQHAAYRLLPEEARQRQHLRIGRLLLAATALEALDAVSFDLAAQFNHAGALLTPAEKLVVADLNLRAGRRAKAAAAFEAALAHFNAGRDLLPDGCWQSNYPLAFALARESAECAYATGETALAQRLFDQALEQARDRLDRARIYGSLIMNALNAGRARDAWALGGTCLAEFGIALGGGDGKPGDAIAREVDALRRRLVALDVERLVDDAPACSDEQEAVADLLLRLYVAGYQMGKQPYADITLRMLAFGLQARHKSALAFGMMSFAVILGGHHGAYGEAEGYAQAALRLVQHLPDIQLRSRIDYIYGSMVAHWTQPVAVGQRALERCYEQALLGADKVYIGLALSFQFRARIMAGEPVPALLRIWEQTAPVIQQINSVPILAMYEMNRQWLRAWKEQTAAPDRLDGDDFDAAAFEAKLAALPAKSPYHWFGLLQAILAHLHGDAAAAARWIRHADGNLDAVGGQLAIPEHHFWRGLILQAAGDAEALPAALAMMEQWRANCADNFSHRALLLRAELLRSQGRIEPALDAYHAAIEETRRQQHLFLQAFALERLGDYFVALKLPHQARAYLQEACAAYQAWGAPAKAHQLQARYPDFAAPSHADEDAAALAVQAIVPALSDIHLDRLLRQVLPLLGRASGARRVAAFIEREGVLMLEGQFLADAMQNELTPHALAQAHDYPAPLIQDSCAMRQPMVIVAPAAHLQYGKHACWQSHPASAVLSLPILRQGRLLGVLYMERSQGDSFAATLSLLESLLRQLGTALENALLYADLKQQIVERTRAEKVAREGERRWRAFLEHAHMAVLTLDLAGTIEYVNPHLCRVSGYAEEELIGRNWAAALLPARSQGGTLHATLLAQLRAHGHVNGSTMLRTRAGSERLISWSTSLLRDPDGQPIGSISIGSDMTDQRNAELALRKLNEELEQRVLQRTSDLAIANHELDSFAYSISHDLRAPLRSIDGFSQALAEDCQAMLDATGQDYLRRVRNAAQRMSGMIDAMLQMSRQTRGALALVDVDLSAMAADVVEELRLREPQRSVQVNIAPGLQAHADARLMRIVLDNLLGNAWKYTAGKPDPSIALHAIERQGETAFCVADNGPGFDMARAGKLFHAFQRLHAESGIEGHGIGLATAQRIIHRHGGRIWAEAEAGKGARFFFTLKP